MTRVLTWRSPGWFIGAAFLLTLAACGGGSPSKGSSARVTDPAKVPSSTPIGDGVTRYLIAGDTVSVAGGTPAALSSGIAGTPAPAATYTVKSGDTCSGIASQFKIAVADLLKNNRTIDAGCTNLHAGDTLRIPASTPVGGSTTLGSGPTPRPTGKSYTVASGDTCDAIARSYGVDLQKLIAANGNIDCGRLQIGQLVNIPQ